ncbi:MAG: hypothetical protein JWN11_849 [Hyphomicrobiales bacterium]|nr:hypothetical protein [Hyphomicrobiales bacterium]
MSLSGPDALRSLDEALRDIRREEDEIAKRLARSAERVTKIRETEGELFRQLAAVRLDPATQAELSGRLSQAEIRARDMLKQHTRELAAAESALKGLDKVIAALTSERAGLLAEVEKYQRELRAISARIETSIAQDPVYAAKRKAAADLVEIAAEATNKTKQADIDRELKGRPYRNDPVFTYLWESGFGTKDYHANRLTAWLDGLVAKRIGYAEARPNYVMLNEIPLRLREHAERQAANAAAAQGELEALQQAAIDANGGKPVREALEAAQERINAIDAKMVAAEDDRDEQTKKQRQLAQGDDPAFAQAISALAEGLGREDIKNLLAEARMTHTGQDDTIIAQIDDARQRARDELADTSDQQGRLKTLAARRRELEDIQYEFKKSGYDDPRSSFREDRLVGELLNDFLKGAITASSYWNSWRGSQNWSGGGYRGGAPWQNGGGVQWPDSSFGGGDNAGGSSTPPPNWGRAPSGWGGFSRPRSGTSSNRTSGGFKTGGGF